MSKAYRAASTEVESSPAAGAQGTRRRIARRLLPFLFLLYVINYIDRTNISFASFGMKGELGVTDAVFGTASGVFFIGYLALQIPGALLAERWSARLLLATSLVSWGAFTVLTGVVRTRSELYAARLLLGAAEAAFFPAVIVYLSHWFTEQDRAKAVARFMAAIPTAAIFGSPLAGLILGVDWLGVPGWRWLFLLEGAPAVLLGIAALFVLPDRPEHARWLRDDECAWLTTRLADERRATSAPGSVSAWHALTHPAVWFLTVALFFCYCGGYAFWFWMPLMLQRLGGWTDVRDIGWLGAIPFVAGLIGMLIMGWSSDRLRERRWHFALPQLTAAFALAAWFIVPRSEWLLLAVFTLVGFGTTAHLPSFWALPSSFLTKSAAAAAIGFINCIASIGGFFGPKLVGELSQHSGSFDGGFVMMIACWGIAALLVLLCPRARSDRQVLE